MAEQLKPARIHTSLFLVSIITFPLHKDFCDSLSFFSFLFQSFAISLGHKGYIYRGKQVDVGLLSTLRF